mmetsp:Transcript_38308/g.89796  ORF Transcript_38308/g.89796 Transcript_38308/m.89796 type:complete len:268 (+) Transcript_38308:3-806(+)
MVRPCVTAVMVKGGAFPFYEAGEGVPTRRARKADGASLLAPIAVAVLCAAALLAVVVLQGGSGGGSVALEAEIGEFGTGLGRRQTQEADSQYDQSFGNDPGHTSRAEIRFNAALHAAGGRGSRGRSARASMKATAPAEWQAFPEDADKGGRGKVTVIVEKEKAVAPLAVDHFGMNTAEARADLGSYFNSLGSQVQKQEKVHMQQVLRDQQFERDPAHYAATPSDKVNLKVSSLFNLIRKAEASKTFRKALVASTKSNYRGSLVGDFE